MGFQGLGVEGLGCTVFEVEGPVPRVQGSKVKEFRVWGVGFKV